MKLITDMGKTFENEDKQSCQSCMQHSALTGFIILQSIIEMFQTDA